MAKILFSFPTKNWCNAIKKSGGRGSFFKIVCHMNRDFFCKNVGIFGDDGVGIFNLKHVAALANFELTV